MKRNLFLVLSSLFLSFTGSAQVVFQHIANSTNTNAHITTLNNTQLNGNANFVVFAQPIYAENGDRAISGAFRVSYQNSRWTIAYQNTNQSIAGVRFQVLAVPANLANVMVHTATAANMLGNATLLNHPILNGNPNAVILVTQQSEGNNHEVGVQYQNNRWSIFNLNGTALPANARFSVLVATADNIPGLANTRAFTHNHSPASQLSNNPGYTVLDNPLINGNANGYVFLSQQYVSVANPNSMMVWYDSPNDNTNYKNGYWLAYGSNPALQVGTKINVVAIGGNPTPQANRDLTGFYRGDNGNCGQAYIRQIGNNVYWFGEHPDGSFGHVFSGTIRGNTLTGNLWDVPKGTLMNKGNCIYNISADGNTLTLAGGTIGCNVLAKTTMPGSLPASKPMQPGSGALTGVWDCNDGAVTYAREDGNDFVFFSEAKNNGTRPGFANLYIGKRNGNTITGDWVDVPKGTHLGSGKMTLSVESDTRIVRADNGNGYGGGVWTRDYQFNLQGNRISVVMATLYVDCGFQGQSYRLQTGPVVIQDDVTFKLSELNIPSNSISSIKLSKGYSATLYFANGGGSLDVLVDEDCLDLHKLTNISSIRVFKDARLKGYVDMHTHPMSHLGFGGKLIHGAPDVGILLPSGNGCRKYARVENIGEALCSCNPTHGGVDVFSNTCGDEIRKVIIRKTESQNSARTGHHEEGNRGFPDFVGWPAYNDITHQQMWIDWIKRAYLNGQRVIVALSVNNATLAASVSGSGDINPDDVSSSNVQIEEMKRLVARHNGSAGSIDNWMEIAYSSSDIRRIIESNRLAVVLGMEVDNIGNLHQNSLIDPNNLTPTSTKIVRDEINRIYIQGVRYIFPIHLVDNKFGGTAIYEDMFNLSNYHQTGRFWDIICSDQSDKINHLFKVAGFDFGLAAAKLKIGIDPLRKPPTPPSCAGHINNLGLTPLGKFAIKEMMKLGMIIDIDHMSKKSMDTSISIAKNIPNGGYPLNAGHNGIRVNIGTNENPTSERSLNLDQAKYIVESGGLIGLGCSKSRSDYFLNNFSVTSYLLGNKARLAIGTDINGFEKAPSPRPGSTVRYYQGFPICQTGNRSWDYNIEGVAHYGLLPDFLRDIKLQLNGYEVINNLMLSAEYFAQMWEKCERQKSQIR